MACDCDDGSGWHDARLVTLAWPGAAVKAMYPLGISS